MRNRFFLAVLVVLAALSVNLAWGQANLPNNPNATTVQGPDPSGMLGYPLATVPATGALPWPVAVQSFAASLCVTQCTNPWVVQGPYADPGFPLFINTNVFPLPVGGIDLNDHTSIRAFGFQFNPQPGDVTASPIQAQCMFGINDVNGLTYRHIDVASGSLDNKPNVMASGAVLTRMDVASANCDFDGSLWQSRRTPNKFNTAATAAAGNAALWTPAAGKKFRLMRWRYTITGSATTAGGADILVKLFDGAAGVTGQQDTVTVPAAATTLQGQLAASPWIDLGNGYLSTAANNVLNINLSAALSAGTVTVEAVGTEE